jgi:hypothetical protein
MPSWQRFLDSLALGAGSARRRDFGQARRGAYDSESRERCCMVGTRRPLRDSEPWQFSSFNASDPNSSKWPAQRDPSFQDCEKVCESVAAQNDEDVTAGATSYYDVSIPPPCWTLDR